MTNNTLRQRITSKIVLTILLLNAVGLTKVLAQSFTVDNLNYSVNSDGVSVTVTGHVDGVAATGLLTIPESVTYEGTSFSVTKIDNSAFHNCRGFTGGLNIPNSVSEIGVGAFGYCSGFTGDLIIPNSVTTIGQDAFSFCSGLTSAFIPSSVESISFNVFEYCSGLEQIEVDPDNPNYDSRDYCCAIIEKRNSRLLTGCKNSIIPNTISSIGTGAFMGCTGLTSIVIPNSISWIWHQAFAGCTGLTTIELPCVSHIESYAFSSCSGLTSIALSNSLTSISSSAFSGCTSLTSIVLPNSLQRIGYNAFQNCTSLTSITIPSSVTNIGYDNIESYGLFNGCTSLAQIVVESGNTVYDSRDNCNAIIETSTNTLIAGCMNTIIPNSVTAIGNGAFNGCVGLTSINIPNAVTIIPNYAFFGCSNLTELVLPETIDYIGIKAFCECSSFTSIEIPNSVTYICRSAFEDCMNVTEITIGEGVTTIGRYAFACPQLQTMYYNAVNCSSIGNDSDHRIFTGEYDSYDTEVPIVNLFIGDNVQVIPNYLFENAINIVQELTLPQSLHTIGKRAFYGCINLPNVEFPEGLISIGESAFCGCNGLSSIYVPTISIEENAFSQCAGLNAVSFGNELTTIGDYAFYNCNGVSSIFLPSSVSAIGNGAFYGCDLEGITVATDNQVFDSRGNCNAVIETNSNRLITGCMNSIIPNSVTSIGNYAFAGCIGLTSIEIPNSVAIIDNGAFDHTGLISIEIPNSVTSIGEYAFRGCDNLTSVTVFSATPPALIGDFNLLFFYGAFSWTSNTLKIYVPYESLETYKTASNWSYYQSRIYPWLQKSISGYGTSAGGWCFIASPLWEGTDPMAVDNMISETAYDLYRFDQSEEAEWQNYKANSFNLVNGQGYLYANSEDMNLVFKGNFNEDETKEVELVYDANATFAGWNLVGNPFPVSAYANKSYYVMNEDGTAIEPIVVSTTTAIEPCTGIMVKADGVGESVTFTKSTRQVESNGLLQIAVAENTRSNTIEDKAVVSFNEGDALGKFVFNKNNAQISIPQGGEDYAIACAEKRGKMPLNFKAAKNGSYTLNINPEAVEMEYLHLIDNLTGNDIDLLVTPSYTFEAKTSDYASRFRLVFSVYEDVDGDNEEPFAYISNGSIIVTGDYDSAMMQIVDLTGRVVVSTEVANNVSINGIASGVYVLRLINGENVRTQKIVIH